MKRISWTALGGFGLSVAFAVHQQWSLPELCWGFWISGLVCSWAFALAGALRILLAPASAIPTAVRSWPPLANLPAAGWRALLALSALAVGFVMVQVYAYLFGFYGLFLSVFAEMEPHHLFGRNGFINSDFYGPVVVLLERFWALVIGALATDLHLALRGSPWRVARLPFSLQLLPMHLMVLAVPFVSLLFWALVGERYHLPAVVLVLALFHFLPRERGAHTCATSAAEPDARHAGRASTGEPARAQPPVEP